MGRNKSAIIKSAKIIKSGFENEIFLVSRNFFSWSFISKMGVKMNLRIITKNNAADSEIGFLTKSISRPMAA